MDIKDPNKSNKKSRLFTQSLDEIETDYEKDIKARTEVKKEIGLLQGMENLEITDLETKNDAMMDVVDTAFSKVVLMSAVGGLILLNGIMYPKYLKMGRRIMGKPSKQFTICGY